MTYEQQLREQQEKQFELNKLNTTGQVNKSLYDESTPVRDLLRERLHQRIRRSIKDQSKVEVMKELDYLLDKNPEVARILELIEVLGTDIGTGI